MIDLSLTHLSKCLRWPFLLLQLSAFAAFSQGSPLDKLDGVEVADVSLDGTWHFQIPAPKDFWKELAEPTGWKTMPVPGDVFREGHLIKEDEPFAYKRKIAIPSDFAGQKIRLRFEGAHEFTRVWVNGKFIAEHQGGWTPWECDITPAVTPGQDAWIALEITDLKKDIAFNGKRLRAIGGLVRSLSLQARPKSFLEFPIVSSPFSEDRKTATLTVIGQVETPSPHATASFRLFDPEGKEVPLAPPDCQLDQPQVTWMAKVASPQTWDAEHSRLYRLEISSKAPGQATAVYSKHIGFRDITFDDKKNMLINGKVVKLRGANRHLVNPLKGFVPEPAVDNLDVRLFKESNMNFVRTSHYPPGAGFVEQCDEQGLYVNLESAVLDCGKANRPSVDMSDDPQYEHLFINQQREVLLNYGSHPSIILWSICNESVFGRNFTATSDFARKLDPSRPITASYQVKDDPQRSSYDIRSWHYPKWDQNYEMKEMPVIYDEWMHVLGHSAELWIHDPNARDYWGRSLDKAWTALFSSNGSIGAAIWNYADDMTICPEPINKTSQGAVRRFQKGQAKIPVSEKLPNLYGTARWGIVDEWRRPKPEFWNVKKAYSPVRLLNTQVTEFEAGKAISLPVHNRFDHTHLDEVTLLISYDGKTQEMKCPPIAPHQQGAIELPASNWKANTEIGVSFLDRSKKIIDDYRITLGHPANPKAPVLEGAPKVVEGEGLITVQGKDFTIAIDRSTGLIQSIKSGRVSVPLVGPIPHIFKLEEFHHLGINPDIGNKPSVIEKTVIYNTPMLAAWKMKDLRIEKKENAVAIHVTGQFEAFDVDYLYTFAANGRMDIGYQFKNLPPLDTTGKLPRSGEPVNLEVGIKFQTSDQFDRLHWDKKTYWSSYPEGHLGSATGSIELFSTDKPVWAQKPTKPWHKDTWDFYLMGWPVPEGKLLTYEASAAKQAIRSYTLDDREAKLALTIHGDGENTTARYGQFKDNQYYLYLLDSLDYHLRWGNYSASKRSTRDHEGVASFSLIKMN
jgi:beta-galactosidase/beta-glucuronidase